MDPSHLLQSMLHLDLMFPVTKVKGINEYISNCQVQAGQPMLETHRGR